MRRASQTEELRPGPARTNLWFVRISCVQLKFYFTFDIVESNIFARLHNFPPLVDKSHPDSEVEDDVKKEINENLKLKMISRMKSISTKMSLTIDDLRLDVLQSAVILKNY